MAVSLFLLLFRIFLKKDVLEAYPTKAVLATALGSTLMMLTIYWFTAKAFVPKLEILGSVGSDYFTFIVVGELALAIPATLITHCVQTFRSYCHTGTLEPMLVARTPFERILVLSAFSSVILALGTSLFTVLVATTIFRLDINLSHVGYAIVFQIVAYPIFLAIGLFSGAVFIYFGRGAGLISSFAGLVGVFAGVYFPTTVFPKQAHELLTLISPYNLLVNQTRNVLIEGWTSVASQSLLLLFVGGLVFFPLAYYFLGISVEKHRKRGISLFHFG